MNFRYYEISTLIQYVPWGIKQVSYISGVHIEIVYWMYIMYTLMEYDDVITLHPDSLTML